MSLADELNKLEDLRRRGVLSEAEFEQAKAAVLAGGAAPQQPLAEHLSEQLAEVRYQNELARLDREWQVEREQYMILGQYGRRHIPTPATSLARAVVLGVGGILWTIFAFALTSGAPDIGPFPIVKVVFPLFGVLFTCAGIGMGLHAYSKAQKYRQALAAYQRRRSQVQPEGSASPPEPGRGDDRVTT